MAILYDINGNLVRNMAAQGGDVLTDPRAAATLGALNAETVIDLAQEQTVSIDTKTSSFNGTLIFEVSTDGTNYQQYPIWNSVTELYVVGISSAGAFQADIPRAAKKARIRCSAYTTGAMTVVFRASIGAQFNYSKDIPSSMISATGAAGAAVTLTIPVPGIGLFNYLTGLSIVKFNSALLTAAVAPVVVTTTGIIGTPAFSFNADAAAQGTSQELQAPIIKPVKGTATNTAMTIVCPLTASILWRVNASFYIGA